MYKKIIAFLFSFSIVVSLFSASASAADIYGGGAGRLTDFWSLSYKMWLDGQSDWNPGGIFTAGGGGRDDFASRYADYVSTLPSTTVSSSTVSSADTYLYNGVELPALPFLDTYPYVVMYQSINSSTGEVYRPYQYVFFCSESPIYLTTSSSDGELLIYMEVPCSYYYYYSDGYTNSNGDTGWIQGTVNTNWGGTFVKFCDFIWANHNVLNVDGTVYLAASEPVPVGTTSTTNDRFGLFMEELDEWNNTYGYDANEYAANYFISPDAGDSLYSPAVFSESTMTFTEPTTGFQYLCTDWHYYYDPDLSAWYSDDASFHEQYGMYFLEIADSSYYVDSTAVDIVGICYADDFIRIGTFIEDSSSDAGYTMLSYQDYSYVMVSQTECGLNGHTYTYETVTEATCGTAGERKYTCSVCGNEYAEDIPATGSHTYKSSVTQEATCAVSGVMTYTCSTCGTEYTEMIAPTGIHSYQYAVSQDPTCTADGVALYTCSVCGDQYTEPIPAVGHSYKLIEYVAPEYDENGTAVSAGHYLYECSVCGNQYSETDEIPVTEESWFSWLGGLFKKAISAIVNGFASGIEYLLEHVIGAVSDFIVRVTSWAFNLFDGSALVSWFDWFSEDNAVMNNEFAGSGAVSEVDVWAYSFG